MIGMPNNEPVFIDASVWITILMIIIVLIVMGFVTNIQASTCYMPELNITGKNVSMFGGLLSYTEQICPNICYCNNTYDKCQIPACEYTRCWLSWYNICLIHK